MGLGQNVLVEIVRGNTSLSAIAEALSCGRHAVVGAVQKLKTRGFVALVALGGYEATDAGREFLAQGGEIKSGQASARPRKATRGIRQRAWWVIRARKDVTLAALLSTLADGREKDAAGNLGRYLRALERSGFLAATTQRTAASAPTSPGHKRYRLVRDNGRMAPVLRQTACVVFDPNTGETFSLKGEQ